jgi:hypothetical protein
MSWSIWNLFRTPGDLFKRHEENRLMLEQYLAVLEARFVLLSRAPSEADRPILAEAQKVVDAYRAYRVTRGAPKPAPLPDWNEAFLAEQLLSRLLPPEEARAELVSQLAALKSVDPGTYAELSAEWEEIKDNPDTAQARTASLLVSALRATQWKNTQRWIVRTLGTRYAMRLRNAFLLALLFGIGLVALDAFDGPGLRSAALSGLGFAAAAGLLGASFSAMVGQEERVLKLDNIEEARAATSPQMIGLRMGVGVAAAMILYFFFESGLVEGALFPDLAQIGFGRVTPLGTDLDALRASAQALEASTDAMVTTIAQALQQIEGVVTSASASGEAAAKLAEFGGPGAANAAVGAPTAQLMEKLQVTGGELLRVSAELDALKRQWAEGDRPLGLLAPNADLSKLVVWCFAAGFAQTLVPSMLAKVAAPASPS